MPQARSGLVFPGFGCPLGQLCKDLDFFVQKFRISVGGVQFSGGLLLVAEAAGYSFDNLFPRGAVDDRFNERVRPVPHAGIHGDFVGSCGSVPGYKAPVN